MKEEILALLKAKFEGVSEAVLSRIADKLAKTATTSEEAASSVEGVTLQSVIESYGDARATESAQSAVSNYEKKHGLKEGKEIAPSPSNQSQASNGGDGDSKVAALEKTIAELAGIVKGVATSVSVAQKSQSAKELFANSQLPAKWFGRIDVDSEIPVSDQIKELEAEYAEIKQGVITDLVGEGNYTPSKNQERSVDDYAKLMDGESSSEAKVDLGLNN